MLSAPLTGANLYTQNTGMTFSQAVKVLEEAGFNQEQARAVAEAVGESVATKADLLELELHLSEKFDTKLGTLDKKFDTKIEKLDTKIDALDEKIDTKVDALDTKFNAKFDTLNQTVDTKNDALNFKFEAKFDALDRKFDAKFDALNNRLLVGALSIVAALVASIAGATFTLVQLLK